MSSNKRWINVAPVSGANQTGSEFFVAMNYSNANYLYKFGLTISPTTVIFGDMIKWCHSFMFFPFDVYTGDTPVGDLYVGADRAKKSDNNYVQGRQLAVKHLCGYTLGEYHYKPYYNDFRDYEPYTVCNIYLPYYGYITLPIKEIINKYIQFRLNVDFRTGQGLYIIGVTNSSVPSTNSPYRVNNAGTQQTLDDSNTRIIGKYVCQLGVQIPMTSTGLADAARNLILGASKAVVSAATKTFSPSSTIGSTSDKYTSTVRNPETGRQITAKTFSKESTREVTYNHSSEDAFTSSIDLLNNLHLHSSTDNANNPNVDFNGARSIKIVIKRAKVLPITAEYKRLYGVPLGTTQTLGDLSGYTEISRIHLEGTGFNSALDEEKMMLIKQLESGVIL